MRRGVTIAKVLANMSGNKISPINAIPGDTKVVRRRARAAVIGIAMGALALGCGPSAPIRRETPHVCDRLIGLPGHHGNVKTVCTS